MTDVLNDDKGEKKKVRNLREIYAKILKLKADGASYSDISYITGEKIENVKEVCQTPERWTWINLGEGHYYDDVNINNLYNTRHPRFHDYSNDGETKWCTGCGKYKKLSEFYKNSIYSDGLNNKCIECSKSYSLSYYEENKEKSNKQSREYYNNNKEELSEKSKEYRKKNRDIILKRTKEYDASHTDSKRDKYLRRTYGITLDDYNQMYADQDGKCAICGKPQSELKSSILGVDHNHENGQVRALLCSSCNSVLGHSKENVSILNRVIEYIKKYNKGTENQYE
jgi:hypothetical protein